MSTRTVLVPVLAVAVLAALVALAAPAPARAQQASTDNAPPETLADDPDGDQRAPGTVSVFGAVRWMARSTWIGPTGDAREAARRGDPP